MSSAIEINSINFTGEVEESDLPVLIDFWAPWCGPCLQLAPTIDEIATQFAGSLKVGKIDTDKEPGLAGRFGVLGIPFIALFKEGQLVASSTGVKPKAKLLKDLGLEVPTPR